MGGFPGRRVRLNVTPEGTFRVYLAGEGVYTGDGEEDLSAPQIRPAEGTATGARRPGTAVPAELAQALLGVTWATASCRDLESLLHQLVAALSREAHFNEMVMVLHDPVGDVMRLHTTAAVKHPVAPPTVLPVAESPSGTAWQTQRPLVIPDIDRETRYPVPMEIWLPVCPSAGSGSLSSPPSCAQSNVKLKRR